MLTPLIFLLRSSPGTATRCRQCVIQQWRGVAKWSPLAAAFITKPVKKMNFSLSGKHRTGLFGIPELKEHHGFYLLQEGAEEQTRHLVAEATSKHRKRKMVQIFDDLSDNLCRVADLADFVRSAHPDKQVAGAAEDACMAISGLVEQLNTNVELYEALKKVAVEGDIVPTTDLDKRVTQLFLHDFQQSGIHLDEEKRRRFVELNDQINTLGTFFTQGCHRANSVPKSLIPEIYHNCFTSCGDDLVVNSLYADHHDDRIREAAYKIYHYPDPHQEQLLESLLTARNDMANLVGFNSFAQRTLNSTMVGSPEMAEKFLMTLANETKESTAADFKRLLAVKTELSVSSNISDSKLHTWDTTYYAALARHERCQTDQVYLAQYFSLGSCIEGLNVLFQSLYGVSLVHEETIEGETWHQDVHKLRVERHDNSGSSRLGYIYCDMYERSGKPMIDCHYTIRGGRTADDESIQLPVVVLKLNFPAPTLTCPSLLTPNMMENLYHEFGHAMHSMLGRTKYQHITGTRCSTDIAEVPSVLMEYFASDPRVIKTFARHYRTGKPLSDDSIDNLVLSRSMFASSEKQLQILCSLMDLRFHGQHPLGKSTTDLLAHLQSQYYTIPPVPKTGWHLRFSHLVGYGAKYYSYLLSRAMASAIWQQMFQKDPFSRTEGEKYERGFLSHGGGTVPQEMINNLLGHEVTIEDLASSLATEVNQLHQLT